MTTTVNQRYLVDLTGGSDEFSPDRIIGQLDTEFETIVHNSTWCWSRANLRRLATWGNDWAPIDIQTVGYTEVGTWSPFVSEGRGRYQLLSTAINTEVRLTVTDRAGVPIGPTVTNTHGGIKTTLVSVYATNTTGQAIKCLIETRQNGGVPNMLYTFRIKEQFILAADLFPIAPSGP